MDFFGAAHGWGAKRSAHPKICHTYPTMMKLSTIIPYLKKIQNIYESHDTPLEFCWHQHFFTRNQQILLHQEMQMYIAFWYIISNSFNFSWVFVILMSAKMATPGLLKIKLFLNEGYDIIISVHDVINKILSRNSSYIVDVLMWRKSGTSSISMTELS